MQSAHAQDPSTRHVLIASVQGQVIKGNIIDRNWNEKNEEIIEYVNISMYMSIYIRNSSEVLGITGKFLLPFCYYSVSDVMI